MSHTATWKISKAGSQVIKFKGLKDLGAQGSVTDQVVGPEHSKGEKRESIKWGLWRLLWGLWIWFPKQIKRDVYSFQLIVIGRF